MTGARSVAQMTLMVSICTPILRIRKWRFWQQKQHLWCEKPMATSLKMRRSCDAAKANGVKTMLGYNAEVAGTTGD